MSTVRVDETFVSRTATLRVLARLLGVSAAAGTLLGPSALLAAAWLAGGGSLATLGASDALGWAPPAATIGLFAGVVAGLLNACLVFAAPRRWPVAVVRWMLVPIPVVAAGAAALLTRSAPAALVSGCGALVVALALGPWCLAPAWRTRTRA
ncbi:hypothetical protein [Xylanimonas ulmi]|uniref:Uncharacterized protein n=1 Tax=Xylanimonas ulmi TaxID=228973 RepID=A0A4Q7M1E6_9MICO|nr:hypothetical protein [Xylanibacterium ulmi]RZS60392.1 hypothetical protein EV386_0647 [Xylanibacterium ulmi]